MDQEKSREEQSREEIAAEVASALEDTLNSPEWWWLRDKMKGGKPIRATAVTEQKTRKRKRQRK